MKCSTPSSTVAATLATTFAGALALASVAAPQLALASGFALKEQSASGLGTAFAGATAIADDPSVLFFNPAGSAHLEGVQLLSVGSYVAPKTEFSGSVTNAARINRGGNGSPGDSADNALLPAAYAVYPLDPNITLGLAVTSPWGMTTDYDSNWAGRYHALKTDLRTYNISPSLSYRLTPTLSLGAGMQIQYVTAELSQAVDVGTLSRNLAAPDGRAKLEGDDLAVGFTAGALFEPAKGTRIGIGYRSPINHELTGTVTYTGVPGKTGADIKAKLTTPDSVSLGLYQQVSEQVALVSDVAWTHWSRFKELRINSEAGAPISLTEEKWDNTWFLSLGAIYHPVEDWTLRAGFAYDQSPVSTDYRTPRIPDNNRYWLAIGAGYQINQHISVDAAYAHLFVPNSSINLHDSGAASDPNLGRGNLVGSYSSDIDIASIQVRYKF